MKKKLLHSLYALTLAAFTAIGSAGVDFTVFAADTATEAASESDEDYGVVEIQSGDRTVTFTSMPKRVVCVEDVYVEELLALGLQDVVVGRGRDRVNDILPEYQEAYSEIPLIDPNGTDSSTYPSYEMIISLEPDLVMADHFDDKYNASFESYAEKGANCLQKSAIYAELPSCQQVYDDLTNLGKIFKVEDRAQELIDELQGRIETVSEKIGDVEEPLKVVVCDSQDGNEIFTAGKHLESELIRLAGGENVFAADAEKSWMTVSAEQIVEANPDVVVFNAYGTTPVEDKIEEFKNTAAFADLPAVKNDRLYPITLLDVYDSIHIAQGVETLAKEFYPDKFE